MDKGTQTSITSIEKIENDIIELNLDKQPNLDELPNLGKLPNLNKLPNLDKQPNLVKQPDFNLCRSIRLYFREYCLNSSLHGIRYLGEKGRTKIERVWWFLFFIASIFMCSQLIQKTWQKWESMPVIIGFAETPTRVWQIPFPAITVCSETKIRQTVYNFTGAYHMKMNLENMTAFDEILYSNALLLCDSHLGDSDMEENTASNTAIDFIEAVAPDFDELIWMSVWNNDFNITVPSFFTKSLTEEGYCYTFNMLDGKEVLKEEVQNEDYFIHNVSSDWSLEKGYKKGTDKNFYPLRTFGSGKKAGLTILLRAHTKDFDYMCRGPFQGFKVILHNPDELPRVGQHFYIKGSWNQEINVAVQPDIMVASSGVKNYQPSRRNCFFSNEKQLKYFKTYTQSNCEVECLTNSTLSKCGCVAFHMPRTKYTPICASVFDSCAARVQKLFEQNSPFNYFSLLKKLLPKSIWNNKWMKNFITPYIIPASDEFQTKDLRDDEEESEDITPEKCNCLPRCSSLAYSAETTQTDFNFVKVFEAFRTSVDEFPDFQLSRIHIYFKDTQFMTWRRSELYDQTDFLASCGGLLGLFMGFSFLSLIEIAYFLTLRFWCSFKVRRIRLKNVCNW